MDVFDWKLSIILFQCVTDDDKVSNSETEFAENFNTGFPRNMMLFAIWSEHGDLIAKSSDVTKLKLS